ncbi:hypothetical protein DZF72_09685 [Vibrio parahaemolyticus]|nr:hypothetical protein [Vibrio parahaemolyticus]EGR2217963.1 hypothetical protein [Vibrio parahaemolyticus]EGR2782304.1 hypothetical protein [Vibrio parahaemolyticus]
MVQALVVTGRQKVVCSAPVRLEQNNLHIGITTLSLSGMVLSVSKSDYLGILPLSFAKEWEEPLKLQILPCPIENQLIDYNVIYHKRNEHNAAHQNLREHIRHEFTQSFSSLY